MASITPLRTSLSVTAWVAWRVGKRQWICRNHDVQVGNVGTFWEQNVDIRVIQVLLGHSKLETTTLYTRIATNTIRAVMSPLVMPFGATDDEAERYLAAFQQGLQELGWTKGRNVTLEIRYLEGQLDRSTPVASDLVGLSIDVLVTEGSQVIQDARKVAGTIPIVMVRVGDAVGAGFAASLARPGGNLTGMSLYATEQGEKRLELLKEILPRLVDVAMLWNPKNPSQRLQAKNIEVAAAGLKIHLRSLPVRESGDFEPYIQDAARAGAQAFITLDDVLIQSQRARIVELAMRQRLPVVGEFKEFTDAGALMTYSADSAALWHRAASYVDRILKGAKPADLPVELPTRFQLVINLKTAKALGLTVPDKLLATADEVIE
jgi:putative ABC transport system substrate-binding protein